MPTSFGDLISQAHDLVADGDLAGAQELLGEALGSADPRPANASVELAEAAGLQARVLVALGEPHRARGWAAFAYAAATRLHGQSDQRTVSAAATLAAVLHRVGSHARAARLYRDVITELTAMDGPESLRVLAAHADLATVEYARGQCELARSRLRDAWELHREVYGDGHLSGIKMLARLGGMERDCGRFAQAHEHLSLARELCRAHLAADHPLAVQVAALARAAANPDHVCADADEPAGEAGSGPPGTPLPPPPGSPDPVEVREPFDPLGSPVDLDPPHGLAAPPGLAPPDDLDRLGPPRHPDPPLDLPDPGEPGVGPAEPPYPRQPRSDYDPPYPASPPPTAGPHRPTQQAVPYPRESLDDEGLYAGPHGLPDDIDLDDGDPDAPWWPPEPVSGGAASRPGVDLPPPLPPAVPPLTGHGGAAGPAGGPPPAGGHPAEPFADQGTDRPAGGYGARAGYGAGDGTEAGYGAGDGAQAGHGADTGYGGASGLRDSRYGSGPAIWGPGRAQRSDLLERGVGAHRASNLPVRRRSTLPVRLRPAPGPAQQRRMLPVAVAFGAVVVLGAAAVIAGFALVDEAPPAGQPGGGSPAPAGTPTGSAAPVPPGSPPTQVRLRDEQESITLVWTYPAGATAPVVIAGGVRGQEQRPFEELPAGTASTVLSGLDPDFDYCFTVAVVYAADTVGRADPVCTDRGGSSPAG